MRSAVEHYAATRDKYRTRAARRGWARGWWRHCAATCERHRLEAVARGYGASRSGWGAPTPVREVARDGR